MYLWEWFVCTVKRKTRKLLFDKLPVMEKSAILLYFALNKREFHFCCLRSSSHIRSGGMHTNRGDGLTNQLLLCLCEPLEWAWQSCMCTAFADGSVHQFYRNLCVCVCVCTSVGWWCDDRQSSSTESKRQQITICMQRSRHARMHVFRAHCVSRPRTMFARIRCVRRRRFADAAAQRQQQIQTLKWRARQWDGESENFVRRTNWKRPDPQDNWLFTSDV